MKKIATFIFSIAFSSNLFANDFAIGEERILPLRYPKFSITGEYAMNRKFHGFADSSLRSSIERRFDGSLSFEAGLLKYLNAGGLFGTSITSFKKPFHIRMGLFAKPQIPLSERFAIFVRLATGVAVDLNLSTQGTLGYYSSFGQSENFAKVFKLQQYAGIPVGGFGAATVGLEVFPLSRLGLAVEWGIRTTLLYMRRSMPLTRDPEIIPGAPSSFNFMFYELPIMLTLHMII